MAVEFDPQIREKAYIDDETCAGKVTKLQNERGTAMMKILQMVLVPFYTADLIVQRHVEISTRSAFKCFK